jgi:inhibitor of KinA sporulation pathway (predicted exonuclease)
MKPILFVDVESNIAEFKEIIEIGIAFIGRNEDRYVAYAGDEPSILVRPLVSVTKETSDLTGILQKHIDRRGVDFASACAKLRKLGSKDSVWASWGEYDKRAFALNCESKEVPYPFGPLHINAKALWIALNWTKPDSMWLKEIAEKEGLTFIGKPHNGGDDAYMGATLLAKMLNSMDGKFPEVVV